MAFIKTAYIYSTRTHTHTDAPEIEVERPFVHTGVGHETQLVCIVHAEPAPHVIWYKGSTQLGVTEQHSQQVGVLFRVVDGRTAKLSTAFWRFIYSGCGISCVSMRFACGREICPKYVVN